MLYTVTKSCGCHVTEKSKWFTVDSVKQLKGHHVVLEKKLKNSDFFYIYNIDEVTIQTFSTKE